MRGKESENETSPPGPTAAAALKSDIDPYWPIYQFLIFWHLNQILNTINDVFKVCSATLQADAESESKEALLSLPPDIVDVSILSFFPTRYYSTTRILSSLPYPTRNWRKKQDLMLGANIRSYGMENCFSFII